MLGDITGIHHFEGLAFIWLQQKVASFSEELVVVDIDWI